MCFWACLKRYKYRRESNKSKARGGVVESKRCKCRRDSNKNKTRGGVVESERRSEVESRAIERLN